MIIDSHAHLFSSRIIDNVSRKREMVSVLGLQTEQAGDRTGPEALKRECDRAHVTACLVLPTASAKDVVKVNSACLEIAEKYSFIYTAGTLHPDLQEIGKELLRLKDRGVRAIKLCSFSQGFDLRSSRTVRLFEQIREANIQHDGGFFVILDTFFMADRYFGTDPQFNTTPERLAALVDRFPQINFVGAHMGGLTAPPDEIFRHLHPRDNLFLDTSNAAHTLSEDDFVRLVKDHGPTAILFGTDWPWFGCDGEIERIDALLDRAGFDSEKKRRVFGQNVAELMQIVQPASDR
jgi:predicted TIM-barrel fold metal-dependent hydrolase